MGITINGGHFNGNCVIINGLIVGGGNFFDGDPKSIDEKKSTIANGISRITVNSNCVNVHMNIADTNTIDAHLFGHVTTDGTTEFDISTFGTEVKITVNLTGISINSNLRLYIDIPATMFDTIDVTSKNGDIIISEGVSVRKLNLKSANGNITSNATFEVITASSKNGNTKVSVNAISDVELDVSSKNGNAIVELHNISCCNLSTSSMNGSVHNCFHATTGHNTANGEVSSKNGDVKLS